MDIKSTRSQIINSKLVNLSDKNPNNIYGFFICIKIFLPYFFFLNLFNFLENIFLIFLISIFSAIYAYKFSFILHDCAHSTLFRSKKICHMVGYFFGLIVATNFNTYRISHMNHHSNLGDKNLDNDYYEYSFKEKFIHLIEPLLFLRVFNFLKTNNRLDVNIKRKSKLIWLVLFLITQLIIFIIVSGLGSRIDNIIIYYLSLASVSLFLGRLRTTAEHGKAFNDISENKEFTKSHYPNFLDKFFFYDANFNFHLEHHLFPYISSFYYYKIFNKIKSQVHNQNTLGKSMLNTIFNLKNVRE